MFAPSEGAVIAGRYALERVIGRGGMAEVWRARDRELDALCALKFLLPHLAVDKETRVRFLREARAAATLRSPHAVHILGAGEHEGTLYLAMELLEGESLQRRLTRSGRLDAATTFSVISQVAHALSRAHEAGIVHRDLKPDNIWLWEHRDIFVKVLDFGVAKSRFELGSVRTTTGALLGTPQYMSPEQANGDRELDHRSDLWSLAVITFECLTGKRPYESAGLGNLLLQIVAAPAPELDQLAPELPAELGRWWKRALAREPGDRFQSAQELVDALRPALLGSAREPAPLEPARAVAAPDAIGDPELASVDPLMTTHARAPGRKRSLLAFAGVAVLLASMLAVLRIGRPTAGAGAGGELAAARSASSAGPHDNAAAAPAALPAYRSAASGEGGSPLLAAAPPPSPARERKGLRTFGIDAGAPGREGRVSSDARATPKPRSRAPAPTERARRATLRAAPAARAAGEVSATHGLRPPSAEQADRGGSANDPSFNDPASLGRRLGF